MVKSKLTCVVMALIVGYVGILMATYMFATDANAGSRRAQAMSESLIVDGDSESLSMDVLADESSVYSADLSSSLQAEATDEPIAQVNIPKTGTIMVSSASAISAGVVTIVAVGVLVSIISFVLLIRKL